MPASAVTSSVDQLTEAGSVAEPVLRTCSVTLAAPSVTVIVGLESAIVLSSSRIVTVARLGVARGSPVGADSMTRNVRAAFGTALSMIGITMSCGLGSPAGKVRVPLRAV